VDELRERNGQIFALQRRKVLQRLDGRASVLAAGLDGQPGRPIEQNCPRRERAPASF
jgi:hypothetical protein